MKRNCNSCGKSYEAKRATSKYCSETCRKRAQRRGKTKVKVAQLPAHPEPEDADESALVKRVRSELDAAGRLDTVAGQQSMAIAERMANPFDTGSAVASLSRELRAVMAEALKGAGPADALDELKERRDRRRANAG